ncbi:hypothetical protein [Fimbriimonas ginsengisoli]|uniref:hypothetical protein n=1 Tax=Fimbriimonas ginsengisoli TaxID=1005039 RepID=UPI001184DE27|nr:hypothetical protein [Fimbriimonas ginsengisoli]
MSILTSLLAVGFVEWRLAGVDVDGPVKMSYLMYVTQYFCGHNKWPTDSAAMWADAPSDKRAFYIEQDHLLGVTSRFEVRGGEIRLYLFERGGRHTMRRLSAAKQDCASRDFPVDK